MITARHFKEAEFNRCSPACSLQDMDQAFINTLDMLRDAAGIPLVLTSAFRSSAWDKSHGRTGTGAHTKGKAVDIRCNASATRLKIVRAAISLDIRRIGVAGSFVHIDTDATLPDGIWTY